MMVPKMLVQMPLKRIRLERRRGSRRQRADGEVRRAALNHTFNTLPGNSITIKEAEQLIGCGLTLLFWILFCRTARWMSSSDQQWAEKRRERWSDHWRVNVSSQTEERLTHQLISASAEHLNNESDKCSVMDQIKQSARTETEQSLFKSLCSNWTLKETKLWAENDDIQLEISHRSWRLKLMLLDFFFLTLKWNHFSVLQHATHWHEFLYLCWAHSCQLSHVEVQDVKLQPAGRSAAALQELSRQQLQEARHHAEETAYTPLLSLKCDTSVTLKVCYTRFLIHYLLSQFFLLSISNVCLNMKRTSC